MTYDNCIESSNPASKEKFSYNENEICQILGICRDTARRLIRSGQFRSIKVGREIRVIKSEFDAWLEKQ